MKYLSTLCLVCFSLVISAQNLAERLGYPADAKLLIIHADDVGVSHSQNVATIEAMENGSVNSASIMVPCPWFPEIAKYAAQNREMDFGLHLTITSEWNWYKWGPSLLSEQVGSLTNPKGYLYMLVDSVARAGTAEAVELEIENQVKKALQFGIDVTHLDAHMFGVMHPKFVEKYVEVGRKYDLPILVTKEMVEDIELTPQDVVMDFIVSAAPSDYEAGFDAYYTKLLKNLEPGVSCLLIHTAHEDKEMTAVTMGFEGWGANWRQQDFDFFTSDKCERLLKENNIQLVTWREIRDKITRQN